MIIASGKGGPKPVVRWKPRLRWGALCVALLGSFLAGAHAKRKHWDWIVYEHISSALAAVPVRLEGALHAEPLPVVRLDMKFKHLAKIEAKRAQTLCDGWLRASDDDFVPATLVCQGESARVKVRLKGDRLAHLQGDDWSFRIKCRDAERPFGMRTFSLQHPETRRYLNEWCFLEHARRENILAVRYQFVRFFFNGEDKGIYALEEHFSKELLEAQGRREGVIVAFEEPASVHLNIQRRGDNWDLATRLSAVGSQEVRSFDTKRIMRSAALRTQRDEALELLRAFQEGRRRASDVFDVELTARFMALVDLWQAWHAAMWQNIRYYYNPVTARLEPIAFDTMALWGDGDVALIATRSDDRFVNGPLRDPEIAAAYLRELERLARPQYLDELRAQLSPGFERWRLALQQEFPLERWLQPGWELLGKRQEYIRSAIRPERMVIASAVVEGEAGDTPDPEVRCTIDIRNIALLPVEVVGFRVEGGDLMSSAPVWQERAQDGIWRTPDDSVGIAPAEPGHGLILATFCLSVRWETSDETVHTEPLVEVATRFPGQSGLVFQRVRFGAPRSARGPRPPVPSVDEALRRHAFLDREPAGEGLRIRSGVWEVAGDLVVPAGLPLSIDPGTVLRFGSGALLYASGPVCLRGVPDHPVVFEPVGDSWGGLVVSGAKMRSTWSHAVVRGTSGIMRGGWMLTGGVTFFESDVTMRHVEFADQRGEDALNVIRAAVELHDCVFADCRSDAFDGDFVTGCINACRFEDVGGDAVDVSGSTIAIDGLRAVRVADKALSVGERSEVTARNIIVQTAGIAVASKDASRTRVAELIVRDAQVGLAAYVKKPAFGPASIRAEGVEFADTQRPVLVQTGSSVVIDGVEHTALALDAEALSEWQVLGN